MYSKSHFKTEVNNINLFEKQLANDDKLRVSNKSLWKNTFSSNENLVASAFNGAMWHEFAKNVILWAVFYLCLRMIQKLFVKFLCLGIDIMLSYSLQFDDKSYIFLKFSNDLQIHIAVKCAGEEVTSEARCSKFYWILQISPIVCVNGAQECDRFIFRYRK